MLFSLLMLSASLQSDVPPVPGLCSAPVPEDRETPGCYQTNEIDLAGATTQIYWSVYEYPSLAQASRESRRHRWSAVTQIHGRNWLYVLGPAGGPIPGATRRAEIGPLQVPPGEVTAHLSEAIFPPGMRTRVHSHPGPEAFYVVEGEQCMDSPTDSLMIQSGGTYVVPEGPHLQAAPRGRRNLVLILAPRGKPFVIPGGQWQPTGFCDG